MADTSNGDAVLQRMMAKLDEGPSRYYDMAGKPISFAAALDLEVRDPFWRMVMDTHLKGAWLSTAHLGFDQGHGRSLKPIIFETALFVGSEVRVLARYPSRRAARKGHKRILKRLFAQGYKRRRP